ncbi:hypothetical protein [Marmoricola sp. RAF53]|uniref:hypothetical protein n=1 Tax=Marmoricola sp. RAF53 TaxID=3233059 RepID=UPI003F9D0194
MSKHPTTGSGEGGSLGTPTSTANTQPPSADQDANVAVSGGGMVDEDAETDPKDTARETGPSADD